MTDILGPGADILGIAATVRNVADFGAIGNGVADDTAAIQKTIDVVGAAGGGVVYLPGGSYKITSARIVLADGVVLRGDGPNSTKILQAVWPAGLDPLITAFGTIDADLTTVTADTIFNAGASSAPTDNPKLTVASTAGISVGDYFLLGSTEQFAPENATRYKGEVVRIKSVDSGTQVTLRGYIRDIYHTANAASIQKIHFLRGVGVQDLAIINTDPGNTGVHNAQGGITLFGCRESFVKNVRTEGLDGAAVYLINTIDSHISEVHCLDHTDNGVAFGYGIDVVRASENITISDCTFRKVRHGVTFDGNDNARGVPRNCVVTNCTSIECTNPGFDIHPHAENITINGCSATNCLIGIQVRAHNCVVTGCKVDHCAAGMWIRNNAHGTVVRNNVIRHIQGQLITTGIFDPSANYDGHGIDSRSDHVVIANNVIDSCAKAGIQLGTEGGNANSSRTQIYGNTISNCGQDNVFPAVGIYIATTAPTGLRIEHNLFSNYTGTTNEDDLNGNMGNGIRAAGTITGNYFIGNTAIGLASGLFHSSITNSTNVMIGNRDLGAQMATPDTQALVKSTVAIAETHARDVRHDNSGILLSGRLHLCKIVIPYGRTISNITFCAGTTAGATLTHTWFCLTDSAFNVLAKTVDDVSASWTANTTKTLALGTNGANGVQTSFTPSLYKDDFYYVGINVTGTTVPSLLGVVTVGAVTAIAPVLTGASTITLTDPASLGATAGALSGGSILIPYAYVS